MHTTRLVLTTAGFELVVGATEGWYVRVKLRVALVQKSGALEKDFSGFFCGTPLVRTKCYEII